MSVKELVRTPRTRAWIALLCAVLCALPVLSAPDAQARRRAYNLMDLEKVTAAATSVTLHGWAARHQDDMKVWVMVSVDGKHIKTVPARSAHAPVHSANVGSNHGFAATVSVPSTGTHKVCVSSWRSDSECRTVSRQAAPKPTPTPTPTPVVTPPVTTPPVTTPPAPPVTTPPTTDPITPPVTTPPVVTPPVTTPPVVTPPVVTPPVVTPPATGPSCVSSTMGIPQSGAYFGAAVGGTQNMAGLEKQTGMPLGIHRTYYVGNQVSAAVNTVKADLAGGRLPWISFKAPLSWADMAAGKGDAWAIDLVQKLAAVNGPVWLTFHHEPETDGPIEDWKAMQRHLYPLVHQYSHNIAVAIVIIGWNALYWPTQEYRLANMWPGDGYVDILGVDVYNRYGTTKDGKYNNTMMNPSTYFDQFGAFAKAHGVHWAIGETGYSNDAASVNPGWLADAWTAMLKAGGIGMSYFNSSYNSITDWTLAMSAKLTAFSGLLKKTARVC